MFNQFIFVPSSLFSNDHVACLLAHKCFHETNIVGTNIYIFKNIISMMPKRFLGIGSLFNGFIDTHTVERFVQKLAKEFNRRIESVSLQGSRSPHQSKHLLRDAILFAHIYNAFDTAASEISRRISGNIPRQCCQFELK